MMEFRSPMYGPLKARCEAEVDKRTSSCTMCRRISTASTRLCTMPPQPVSPGTVQSSSSVAMCHRTSGRKPPRQITRAGDQVSFGADRDLIFRSLEETTNWLVRIKKDGRERERLTTAPVLEKLGVSPDGKWVIVLSTGTGEDAVPAVLAVPIHGGAPKKICVPDCSSGWSSDGRFFYVAAKVSANPPGKTLAIPVPAGKSLPDLPA